MPNVGHRDAPLVDLVTLELDPTWDHIRLWEHPLGHKLAFTYLDLESGLQETSQPTYGDTNVIGRAEFYKTYTGTSNREIPLTFQFQVQGVDTLDPAEAARREVVLPARFLDALKFPVFSVDAQISYAPPPCLLRIGRLLSARVLVTQADVTWNAPFDTATMLPHSATVAVTFTVVRRLDPYLRYSFEGRWT